MKLRIGYGYDAHRFSEGRPLILGGITVPHHQDYWVIAMQMSSPTPLWMPC